MNIQHGLLIMCAFSVFACNQSATTSGTTPDVLAANIDSSVSAGQDFFQYANGGWIKNNPIPADESGWGIGNLVQEELYDRLRKINEKAVEEKAAHGSISQKISDFWQSGMDTVSLEKQGISPLKDNLAIINKIGSTQEIISAAAKFHKQGIGCLFGEYIAQDDKNSEAMAYQLFQGGLGMPNRDYYFNTDSKTSNVRDAYQKYLYKTFIQLGNDSIAATKSTQSVFQLETNLARASRKLADLRDPYKNYNKMSEAMMQKLSDNINWASYLKQIGINKLDSAIIGQPEFYTALNHELKSTSLEVWKNYLRFHLVMSSAAYLDTTTYNNLFDYRKSLSGVSKPRPRWKRVLDTEERSMGEALGQLFVKEYFNEKAKQRYNDLVEAIRDAYKDRIKNLSWMSDSTKQKALDKLSKITKKVGYPDKWKDFSAMQIDKAPYVINVQKANEWWFDYDVNKLGKPVDRTEWDMSPQTYNAYYNPSNNEIVLPAGMFTVPGKKDEELDDAFVYGYAAASTIGHEMTHGFDDQGRQYDAKGNLKGWWLPDDSVQFTKRASKIIRQFNEFSPVDTLHINGDATQGENIADLGGLLLGLDAFKKTEAYKRGGKVAGFTPVQRYFLGYAYSWMFQDRKERLASQVMTDVHAPAKERVNGPVVNVPDFDETFGIKQGDKMYRADSLQVKIW
ncbi:MAG TPA: M13 family metallopeptidase [Puia sp.]|jgi:putative endopeptidase|nr:M13 family metallopeptidase [Puia sp.]